jgi:hypothetical protein
LPAELGGAGIFKSARLISFAAAEVIKQNAISIVLHTRASWATTLIHIQFFYSRFDVEAALGSDRGPCGLGLPHATRNV